MSFSESWLSNVKQRWRLKHFRSDKESRDTDNEAVSAQMPELCLKLSNFSEKNIFNADERGLTYKMASDSAIARQVLPGERKNRFTILVCCNTDEIEKYPRLLIGHVQRLRKFKKKYEYENGLDYYSNS